MSGFGDLLKEIYDKNDEFGCEQEMTHGSPPDTIVMIDAKSVKFVSPQMKSLYDYALSWKQAIWGLDIVDPHSLQNLYKDEVTTRHIQLTAENYKPLPSSDPSDWQRTALMAVEDGGEGLGLCLYWWRLDDDVEPCVVYISGGSINIFADIGELVSCLAEGTFPERGDRIYKELEQQRGTLRD